MYAYALEAVEHEARVVGGSLIDIRDDFHRRFSTADEKAGDTPSPGHVRDQAKAQAALMGAMAKAVAAR